MAETETVIGTDSSGREVLTTAVRELLNAFPGLGDSEVVRFEQLGDEDGIAFSNDAGALVYTEKEDITGGVHQTCRYPFLIVYRAGASTKEKQKMYIADFLDAFGKWVCRETAVIDGENYHLSAWPSLPAGRKIKKITRNNMYAAVPQGNDVQDWVLPVTIEYENKFER